MPAGTTGSWNGAALSATRSSPAWVPAEESQRVLQRLAAALQRQRLGLGGADLGARAGHFLVRRQASAAPAFDQAQRFAQRCQVGLAQRTLLVDGAQREVMLRHLGLHQQPGLAQQRLAGLHVQRRGALGVRQAAGDVDLPGQAGAGFEEVAAGAGGVDQGAALARGAGIQCELRRARRPGGGGGGTGLRQARGGLLHAGVRVGGTFDQAGRARGRRRRSTTRHLQASS